MATLAAYFRRPMVASEADAPQVWMEQPDPYALRPLPCEDVYFFSKKIVNRVVKQADPRETRRAFRVATGFCLMLVFAVILAAPKGLSMAAGMEYEKLRSAHSRLLEEKASLDLEEARLVNPLKLEEWALRLELKAPSPDQVTTLNPRPTDSVAWNLRSKKR